MTDSQARSAGMEPASVDLSDLQQEWLQQRQLADLDGLTANLNAWAASTPAWPPFARARSLLARIEPRLRALQINLDRVLVVGLIGGSGTGKSTLINALVGERVCEAGDVQRPTTRSAVVVAHEDVDPSFLKLEESHPEVHRLRQPVLENMILIDCPDPDTQATRGDDSHNRNRDVLRRILPQCDVLLYLGTAQKYKTQAVTDELLRHAPGRQIVPVQTHASIDQDIREDWRRWLEQAGFSIPVIFRVDSEEALQRKEQRRTIDDSFDELQAFLRKELSSRARHRIKRANVLGLLAWYVEQTQQDCTARLPEVRKLLEAVSLERAKLLTKIQQSLTERIQRNQHLWRSRLLRQVTLAWGGGPFASFLWLVNSASSLVRLIPLARARSLVPLMLAGGVAVGKSVTDRWKETMAGDAWIASTDLGISQADLTESQSILLGHAQTAEVDPQALGDSRELQSQGNDLITLSRGLFARVETAINAAIERRVARKAGGFFHFLLEVLFCIVPAYLLYRLAANFFYEHPYQGMPLLGLEYWAQAAIWMLLWGLLLRGLLVMRLRAGLRRDIKQLLQSWAPETELGVLFDDLSKQAHQIEQHINALRPLKREVERMQLQFQDVGQWKLTYLK